MADDFENKRKQAEAFAKAIEAARKSMDDLQKTAGETVGSFFDLSTSDFFKEIERSPSVMAELKKEARNLEIQLIKNKKEMNEAFQQSLMNGVGNVQNLTDKLKNLHIDETNLEFIKMQQTLLDSLKNVQDIGDIDISSWMMKNGEEAHNFLNHVVGSNDEFKNMQISIAAAEAGLQAVNGELQTTTELSFSLSKAFGKFVDKKFSVDKITFAMTDFDEVINKSTRDTGILFDTFQNQAAFTKLTIQTAAYGRSVSETAQFMGSLGDKLNSTNFDLLAKAADDTKTFQYAIGLTAASSEELVYNFMRMGKSTSQLKDFVEDTATDAGMLGLNVRKVIEDVSKNMPKFRQYGFQGGEESLKRMVMTAQQLRLNIDEVFELSKKARSIEGAMEMAAELQLAGGSFAGIDPMQLLAAARKSPEELTKILDKMGNDIGKFDEKTGQVQFDPVDADRLEMVSKATELSVDSLMDKITKSKQNAQKENLLGSLFGQLSEEQQDFVKNFTEIGENGQITMSGELKGLSVEELQKMNKDDIAKRMSMNKDNQKDLEKRAKENQALTESLTNFTSALLNFFTIFQLILDFLTGVVTTLTKFMSEYKTITYALIGGFLLFKFSVLRNLIGGFLTGFTSLLKPENLMSKLKGLFNNVKSSAGQTIAENINMDTATSAKGGKGGFLNMSPKKIEALGNAARNAAPGILALGAAILMIGGGIAVASLGLSTLVESFSTLTSAQMVAALSSITIIMGGFIGMTYLLAGAGVAMTAGAGGLLALGGAFLMVGGGIFLAALGMSKFVQAISKMNPKLLSNMGGGLISFAAGLGVLTASMFAFAKPVSLLAFGTMVVSLSALSAVMSNLGPNLEIGGKGMMVMADGVKKLSAALSSISDETLDKLKDIGESVSDTTMLTSFINAMSELSSGNASGKGNTLQTFQIEVIVKNEDGRTIQKRIIKDTELLK